MLRGFGAGLLSQLTPTTRNCCQQGLRGTELLVAPATTTAATAAIPASAGSALGFRTRFIHIQRASSQIRTVEGIDGFVALFRVRHFHERKTARTSGLTIGQNTDTLYLSIRLEHVTQFIFRGIEIQISYEDVLQAKPLFELSERAIFGIGQADSAPSLAAGVRTSNAREV